MTYRGIKIPPPTHDPDRKYLVRIVIEEKIKAKNEEEAIRSITNQTWDDKLGNFPGLTVEAMVVS